MNIAFHKDSVRVTINTLTLHLGDPAMDATVQQILDTVSGIANSMTTVQASLAGIATDVQALKDQIAAGGTVTQADLDNILAQAQAAAGQAQSVADQASGLDAQTP